MAIIVALRRLRTHSNKRLRRDLRYGPLTRPRGVPRRLFVGTELESWMLKATNRPGTATISYNSLDDITTPPALDAVLDTVKAMT